VLLANVLVLREVSGRREFPFKKILDAMGEADLGRTRRFVSDGERRVTFPIDHGGI